MKGGFGRAAQFLPAAASELAEIVRGGDYAQWRSEAAPRIDDQLREVPPFHDYLDVWIYTGGIDRALKLGIAAEIALMHGQGEDNAEIRHKIGTRAAWLLGGNPVEHDQIFTDMKKLYNAR